MQCAGGDSLQFLHLLQNVYCCAAEKPTLRAIQNSRIPEYYTLPAPLGTTLPAHLVAFMLYSDTYIRWFGSCFRYTVNAFIIWKPTFLVGQRIEATCGNNFSQGISINIFSKTYPIMPTESVFYHSKVTYQNDLRCSHCDAFYFLLGLLS